MQRTDLRPDRPDRIDRSDRVAGRRLLTAMALGIVALMAALGFVYLALWSSAADDLTRLLPASTRAYAASPAPWSAMTRSLALPVWRDPATLSAEVLRDGYLASERAGEIGGLPVEALRELVRTMDSLELALVPTADGDTLLVFVELGDTTQKKRALARLAPLLETVDRRVGFRVDKIRRRAWHTFTGTDVEPPRVVDMDPWIILSWGSPTGLEDLLETRVAGRRDNLSRRPGFVLSPGDGAGDLELAIDAHSAWRVLSRDHPEPRPGGLFEYLDLLTFASRVTPVADLLEVRAEITDADLTRTLARGLRRASHELAAIAPADALLVAAATGDDLPSLVAVLQSLALRVQRDLAPDLALDPVFTQLVAAAASLPVRAPSTDDPTRPPSAAAFEIALVALPAGRPGQAPEPLLLVRTPALTELADHLTAALPERLGDGFSHGEVLHGGALLHLVLAHAAGTDTVRPDALADSQRLAWRVRNGLIELAPSLATLERFAATQRTLAMTPRFANAMRDLPGESAVVFIGVRDLLARSGAPLLELLADRLHPDFAFGVTLDVGPDHLAIRSNLGLWSLATAIASGDRAEIDAFSLPGLDPRCRAAYDAFCALYPDAVPCRPFSLGRRARIDAVCRQLFARPP